MTKSATNESNIPFSAKCKYFAHARQCRPETIHYGIFKVLKDILRLDKGKKRCLDLGSGVGSLCNFLASFGHEVYGIDISHYAIKIAKENYPSIPFVVCDIENHAIPFRSNLFDIVFMIHVLEHLRHLDNIFNEIKRVLRKRGFW